jgi:hypothetical protein
LVLVPLLDEDDPMKRRVREGIEKYVHVTITLAMKSMDLYVMTAVEGKTHPRNPKAKPLEADAGWRMGYIVRL